MTLKELLEKFPDEQSCKEYLRTKRWSDGVRCPKCGSEKVFHVTHRPFHWVCKQRECGGRNGYRFSVISGTVFQDTKRPLREWFTVAFLMLNAKKGISSLNVQRIMGFKKEKTAWYMCHRIRAAMKDKDFAKLMGVVEADETLIGGKDKNRHWNKRSHAQGGYLSNKTMVIGAISRKGNITCQMIEDAGFDTLGKFVREAVSDKVTLIATDENLEYRHLKKAGYQHATVTHSRGEYVRGNVHTNSIESFWSLLKRGVVGTYHNVSKKYLPFYLAEFQFCHNHRKNPDIFGEIIGGC